MTPHSYHCISNSKHSPFAHVIYIYEYIHWISLCDELLNIICQFQEHLSFIEGKKCEAKVLESVIKLPRNSLILKVSCCYICLIEFSKQKHKGWKEAWQARRICWVTERTYFNYRITHSSNLKQFQSREESKYFK